MVATGFFFLLFFLSFWPAASWWLHVSVLCQSAHTVHSTCWITIVVWPSLPALAMWLLRHDPNPIDPIDQPRRVSQRRPWQRPLPMQQPQLPVLLVNASMKYLTSDAEGAMEL